MLLAWPVLLQACFLLQLEEEVGAVIEEDARAPANDFFRTFIQLGLDKVGFVRKYGQGPVDLVEIESGLFEELSGLLITGKF